MKGVRYLIDDSGEKTAVMIDLRLHREAWEDLYDAMLAKSRDREPRESLKQVNRRIRPDHRSTNRRKGGSRASR